MIRNNTEPNGGDASPSIENVILIDFQYGCWTSPTIDLHYFLNTSLQESLRPGRYNELIAIYHAHLVDCLERLDYEKSIPNLGQFKKQYDDKKFYGMAKFMSRKTEAEVIERICCSVLIFRFRSFMFSTTVDDQ